MNSHAARLATKEAVLPAVLPRVSIPGSYREYAMAKTKTYYEKLKDPRWQKKRLEILNRSDFSCERCGDKESTLNVHHLRYIKGNDPWDYSGSDLMAMCESCHEGWHILKDAIDAAIAGMNQDQMEQLFGCALGIYSRSRPSQVIPCPTAPMALGVAAVYYLKYPQIGDLINSEKTEFTGAELTERMFDSHPDMKALAGKQ